MANGAHALAESYFAQYGKDKVEHFIALNNFVVNQFVKEAFPYTLTSFLSHDALYSEDAKDLVLYSSVASNSHFCNFAIHPNIVDRYIEFEKVIRFKIIENHPTQGMKFGLGKIGEISSNNIIWRDGKLEEVDFNKFP